MIALVEGAERQKTPNEIALNILLAGLTIIFLLAVVTLQPFAIYSNAPQSSSCWFRCWSADPDDDRRTALGIGIAEWTAWCSTTSWRCRGALSRPPAT